MGIDGLRSGPLPSVQWSQISTHISIHYLGGGGQVKAGLASIRIAV